MRSPGGIAALATACGFLICGSGAKGQTVNPATAVVNQVAITETVFSEVGPDPINLVVPFSPFAGDDFWVAISDINQPSVSAIASNSTGSNYFMSAGNEGELYYQFSVSGLAGAVVPVDLRSDMIAASNIGNLSFCSYENGNPLCPTATASISLIDYNAGTEILNSTVTVSSGVEGVDANNLNTVLMLQTNDTFGVEILAGASAGSNSTSASANIDSFVQVDPGFAAAHPAFSLEVSPGVENEPISSAPEPSSWLLMFAGLGGIGLALRRAERRVGFPA